MRHFPPQGLAGGPALLPGLYPGAEIDMGEVRQRFQNSVRPSLDGIVRLGVYDVGNIRRSIQVAILLKAMD